MCQYSNITFYQTKYGHISCMDFTPSELSEEQALSLLSQSLFHYRTLFLNSVRYTASLVLHMQESNAYFACNTFKTRHDKTNKTSVRPEKTRSAWASAQSDQSSLSAGRYLGSLATHWAYSEDPDQSRRMPRLIWVFAGRTLVLLVLSCRGSIFIIGKTYMLQFLVSQSLRLVMSKPVFRSVSPGKT